MGIVDDAMLLKTPMAESASHRELAPHHVPVCCLQKHQLAHYGMNEWGCRVKESERTSNIDLGTLKNVHYCPVTVKITPYLDIAIR